MQRPVTRLFFTVCLLLPLSPAQAESAQPYLEKMLRLYEKPFSMDMVMDMAIEQGGLGMSMTARGAMLYADQKHMRMTMTMDLVMPGAPGGGGDDSNTTQMKMLTVSDGEHMWMEMESPMMPGKQVMKSSLAEMEKMAAKFGGGMGQLGGMDPLAQIRMLQHLMTFEVVERSGGLVVLKGTPTAEMKTQIGPGLAALGGDGSIRMAITEGGVPRWMVMGPADKPAIRVRLENYKVVAPPAASSFAYTPPAGVQVIDPLAMAGATPD